MSGFAGETIASRSPSREFSLASVHKELLDAIRNLEGRLDLKLEAISDAVGVQKLSPLAEQKLSPAGEQKLAFCDEPHIAPLAKEADIKLPVTPTRSLSLEGMDDYCTAKRSILSSEQLSNFRPPDRPLSAAEEEDLKIRAGYARNHAMQHSVVVSSRGPERQSLCSNDSDNDADRQEQCPAWNPDCRSRTAFDALGIVMLLYDAFMVPYRLAWDYSDEGFSLQVAVWTTRLFWTADLFLNLVTGYRGDDAKLVLSLRSAMKRYLYTFFLPDLALVTCDWLTLFDVSSRHSWMKWMRVMRLVRSGRQVLRGYTLVLKAKLMISSHGFHLIMDLSIFMVLILWANHTVGCGWYSIGRYLNSDTGVTWLSDSEYSSAGGYDYWTALHWAMTQMTPGSMEVRPRSSGERVFNVSILLLGLLMGSSLVATLTSMLTQYKLRVEGSSRKFMILHQFLIQQDVDPNLALAIKLQAKARSKEKARLKPADVEYLSLLSNSMRGKLWHAWCSRQLGGHQLLNSLELVDPWAMKKICRDAIKSMEFPASDAVFEEGAIGDNMYFLVFGQAAYTCSDIAHEALLQETWCPDQFHNEFVPCQLHAMRSRQDTNPSMLLSPGQWCCEPALWTEWTHKGTLEATTTTEVLALSGPGLLATIANFPVAFSVLSDYCVTFHKHINEPGVLRSDLPYTIDICELISKLMPETRHQLAKPVLDRLESRFFLDNKQFMNNMNMMNMNKARLDHLKEEVSMGKCDIGLVDTEVVRNTFIVAIRLYKRAALMDRFLVRVGEVNRDSEKPVGMCLLPGVKRRWRESYVAAVGRILETELGDMAPHVDTRFHEGSKRSVHLGASPTYGIRTRYMRTTFKATLSSSDAKFKYLASPPADNKQQPMRSMTWFLNADSRRAHKVQEEAWAVLSDHTSVVVVRCKRDDKTRMKLYLWLTEHEFAVLGTDVARPVIDKWLSSLPSLEREIERESSIGTSVTGKMTGVLTGSPRGPSSPNHNPCSEYALDADASQSLREMGDTHCSL